MVGEQRTDVALEDETGCTVRLIVSVTSGVDGVDQVAQLLADRASSVEPFPVERGSMELGVDGGAAYGLRAVVVDVG
jgi:hypothetical protein